MEERKEVRVMWIKMICDECGAGEMIFTGDTLLSFPPRYIHKCDWCGKEASYLGKQYPEHEYVPVD